MMKTKLFLLFILSFALLISNCKKDDESARSVMDLGNPGNKWTGNFAGGQQMSAEVISFNNGVLTLKVNIQREEIKLKLLITENSISDFAYSLGDESKPFTLVKFDGKVGDTYRFNFGSLEVVRQIVETGSSYDVPCLGKKVQSIGVAEYIPYGLNPKINGYTARIIYWWISPEYGLTCIEIDTDEDELLYFEMDEIKLVD